MADAEHRLDFFEGGVRVFFDMGAEFLRVKFSPGSPARFRRQCALLSGDQIPVNRTPGQIKPPGRLGFGTPALNEFHHPFPQVQRIGFHAPYLISLCPNVNMKCYSEMIAIGDGFAGANGKIRDGVGNLERAYVIPFFLDFRGTARAYARHQGKANVVFCDGHVESPTLQFLFEDTSDPALSRWNRDHLPHREKLTP
jgi:prepilin-type processing-associated H-X9-DG protein